MVSALITVSLLDIQGRDIRPWLRKLGIKFVVRQDRVDLVSFPPSVELRYFGRWPVLYSKDKYLEETLIWVTTSSPISILMSLKSTFDHTGGLERRMRFEMVDWSRV